MGRMAGTGGLSNALRDYEYSSRRDKLLGLAPMEDTHDPSSSAGGNSSCSELNEEDLWMHNEGDWDARDRRSYGRCWLGYEEDQCSDDPESMAISERFSNLNLGMGYVSGQASNREVSSASIAIPLITGEAGSPSAVRQSAPMKVPNWSEILGSEERSFRGLQNAVFSEDDDDNDERLPPHELIAREYAKNQAPPFSVYEGIGRTLKGRDLDRVRSAVLRKTGYMDYE